MFDPIYNADVMSAMGIDPNHLQNAGIYGRVKDVLDYFQGRKNPRQEILKLISTKTGNPLDTVWTYVQLQKEKQARLAKLNPEDFEPDVAEEIVAGHITIAKKQRIRKDIQQRKEKLAQQKAQQQNQKLEQKKDNIIEGLSSEKLDIYSQVLDEIDSYDKELDFY